MCVLLGFLQKTWAIPIMNPLSWFMINKKIGNFKIGIGIAEKSHKTRRDRWGGNVNHKSLFWLSVIKLYLHALSF